ncbi:FecCD family ABC transporter permease [Chromobacterium alticapitis]|uniref:Iron ABC transporter n=1 Tax=Chromobacterium alticapitis TaxID=2073169 RepID=A0A2S5DCU3_9NEIS|nr:iron ABC transporter permease [Chromobacterium alticapitis]POZ60905.1 iron ABC transporter [Chromobacterium alticapitis]
MRLSTLLPLLLFLLLATAIASLSHHSHLQIDSLLRLSPQPPLEWQLLLELRLPRLLASACAGALLASAGAAVQARFRNPLAEPGLIGINSGGALAAALALSLGAGLYGVAAAGFVGGLSSLLLIRLLGSDRDGNRLILSGLAVSTLLGSLLTLLITTLPDGSLRVVTFWLMGSFASLEWPQTLILLLATPLVWLGLHSNWRFLNALQLGEGAAFYLGFPVRRREWAVILLAALAAGLVVANCGMIGFVGLMAPHLARQLVGGDARRLLLTAPLLGAWLSLGSDWLAQSLLAPAELPVGVITSLLGAPFFLWLLRQQERRHA